MPNKYYIVNVFVKDWDGVVENDEIIGAFEDVESARAATEKYLETIGYSTPTEAIILFENHKKIKSMYREFEYDYEKDSYIVTGEYEY